jgi:hypothetical protein
VSDYRQKSRSKLVEPTFPAIPLFADLPAPAEKPGAAALVLASYLARAWTAWLKSDLERQRRTVQPKTGNTPWIMPAELNEPAIVALPPGFASRLHEEPMV